MLVHDDEQDDAPAPGFHLSNQRTRAAIRAHERAGLGNDTAALRGVSVTIFERARIDSGNRQNIRERKFVLRQLVAQRAENFHHSPRRYSIDTKTARR